MVDFPRLLDPEYIAGQLNNLEAVFQPDKRFAWNVFPQDLSSEQLGHYMIISVYTQSGAISVPTGTGGNLYAGAVEGLGALTATGLNYGLDYVLNPFLNYFNQPGFGNATSGPLDRFNQNNYNVAIFMPSEEGGGLFPTFTDTHEYAEISMSNVILNQIPAAAGGLLRAAVGATGRAINPGVQVLYRSTHLRNFDFSFLFAPRNQRESIAMKEIIKNLRMYAAPVDEGLFYRSPAEIEISFHRRVADDSGAVNEHVIKMKRQTIRQIEVNYAPSGTYSTFSNGHPVHCMMTLRTKEMEIVTRQDVERGY